MGWAAVRAADKFAGREKRAEPAQTIAIHKTYGTVAAHAGTP
ncbi:hypothetical protein BIFGAL_03938 [Bifidobacterium gallicum DSM 20093 = LMG 11596]|uniref:Uncharacterized protein n=1 Tax=Bifidobacterium gallicum DSM 20093 = LMG 11596 TaxID=561180 RepID=D1NVP7_9BIFI|nr:hypothetical protein BIFGAL_03938 [Bifidobacterium gallicum DSM 20093 = LMG 11596]